VAWKDPQHDIIGELADESPAFFISNLSPNTTIDNLRTKFSTVGTIKRIQKYSNKAIIQFENKELAKKSKELLKQPNLNFKAPVCPAKRSNVDKKKNFLERNLSYSVNLLEEENRQFLLKCYADLKPPYDLQVFESTGRSVIDTAKLYQQSQLEMLTGGKFRKSKENLFPDLPPKEQALSFPNSSFPQMQTQKMSQNLSQGMPQSMPQSMPQNQPQNMSQTMPQTMGQSMIPGPNMGQIQGMNPNSNIMPPTVKFPPGSYYPK